MQFIKSFTELNKSSVLEAGGKGASLGEMTQAGILVPPGFVVLSNVFERFLEETDLHSEIDSILHKIDHKKIHTVENASEEIKALILEAKMPSDIASEIKKEFKKLNSKYVAVRSSATAEDSSAAAWAGQLESYLNTTEREFLQNVQRCWASLFTPRAIFYRFEKGLHEQHISVAVVVQKMIQSEVSGIAFSVHPVTQDYNQLIIEAGLGLGEAIVSGSITPDSYVVEKQPRQIADKNVNEQNRGLFRSSIGGNEWRDIPKEIGEKQVLSDKQILDLSDLIIKIENHYGFPCDIEWALERDKFYIVQSRPITTLEDKMQEKKDSLVLLGAWNVLPLEAWRWFDTIAIERLQKLTGVKIRVFTYVEEELHYECVFERELVKLRRSFEEIKTNRKKAAYVTKIYDDFYQEVPKLENYLDKIEKQNFNKFSDREIIRAIKKFADLWTPITMQIWYSVFLDIWYSSPHEYKEIKKIAAKARDYAGRFHERSNSIERKLYAEAAKRLGVDVNFLFPAEIINALMNGTSYAEEIKQRKQFCVTASVEGEYQIYSGTKARELFDKYQPPTVGTEAKRELQGISACNGSVRGTVRVIKRDKDFDKFKDGEILVTLQTMVHYLPIMEKAKAILTEFGGLTSHAAIVSRELNKPCVVGVSNLLASVKDGDLVEVDADMGVVRILESRPITTLTKPEIVIEKQKNKNQVAVVNVSGQNKVDWIGKAKVPVFDYFTMCLVVRAYRNELVKITGTLFDYKYENQDVYYNMANIESHVKLLDQKPGLIEEQLNLIEQKVKELLGASHRYGKIKTIRALKYWTEVFARFLPSLGLVFGLEMALEKKVRSFLSDEEFHSIAFADETSTSLEQKSILILATLSLNSNKFNQALKKHLNEFSWLGNRMLTLSPFNEEQIKERIKAIHGDPIKQLKRLGENRNNLDDGLKAVLSKLDKEKRKIVANYRRTLFLRTERAETVCRAAQLTQPLFSWIGYRLKLKREELLRFSYEEIVEMLKTGQILNFDEREKYHMFFINGNYQVFWGSEGATQEKIENINELFGTVACKGVVQGLAKVIINFSDLGKVKKGDILVASYTTPNMVLAMEKAAAIITNIGGLTSHAAIVSREMNKPCIIGTKIATQVLKDGDLVEINANKGVIKIIK